MKPLALKVMSIVGLIFTTLGCCSAAYGKETLNLELLCDGVAKKVYDDPEKESAAAAGKAMAQLFFEGLANAATNQFSERFSIQDNKLLLKNDVELKVADTAIYLDKKVSLDDKTELVAFDLDRLTGDFEMEVHNADIELGEGVVGMRLSGSCKKLDPKKKLF